MSVWNRIKIPAMYLIRAGWDRKSIKVSIPDGTFPVLLLFLEERP